MKHSYRLFALLLSFAFSIPALAVNTLVPSSTTISSVPKETTSVTQHTLPINGKRIPYTATAGTLLVYNDKAKPIGSFFYVAYTMDGVKDPSKRPVTFLFNGGPGSASVYLHMGSFGPVRVVTSDAEPTPPPPYGLTWNQYSLLDKSDLVFIDAMGTGFSRIVGEGAPKDFYGIDADIESFGKFIQRYITVNSRWNSPKFLLGESYGTVRAAGLSSWLQQHGIALNGIILQSSALNGFVDSPGPPLSLDLPYELHLPTLAAIAWYHNKVPHKPADLPTFLKQVSNFALGDYAHALSQGVYLSAADTQAIAEKLHEFTGLTVQYILSVKLRIPPGGFSKELLRSEGRITGALDARFEGIDLDNAGAYPSYDPADTAITPAFTAMFHWYLKHDLKYKTKLNYRVSNSKVLIHWNMGQRIDGQEYAKDDVLVNLREAMTENPHLKVFSANGYFDLLTPFLQTDYVLDHMGLDLPLMKNISYGYYLSGHMIYLHVPALAKYKADLVNFYNSADMTSTGHMP